MLPLPEPYRPTETGTEDGKREVRLNFVWVPARGLYTLQGYPGWEFEPLFSVPQPDDEADPHKIVGELKFPDGTQEVSTLAEALAAIAVAEQLVDDRTSIVGWLPEDWPYGPGC